MPYNETSSAGNSQQRPECRLLCYRREDLIVVGPVPLRKLLSDDSHFVTDQVALLVLLSFEESFAADGLLVGRKLHQLARVAVDQRSKLFAHGGLPLRRVVVSQRLRSNLGIARLARRTFACLQSLL